MTLRLFLTVFAVVTAMGCHKSSEPDPGEDLLWLETRKTELAAADCDCLPTIWRAAYEGKTIYETGCRGPACDCAHNYYKENGDPVPGSEEGNRGAFLQKVKNRKIIWSCGE